MTDGYVSPEQWREMDKLYRELGDGDLLRLAAAPSDLTVAGQEILQREMARRGLEFPGVDEPKYSSPSALTNDGVGEAKLETFYDAFKAGRACELLEASEIAFRLEDQSVPGDALQAFDGSPPVVLAIFVAARELERAQVALRAMGLFVPESQELDGADSIEDEDDVHWTVAGFESEEEAQALTDRLKTAGIAASVLDLTEDAEAKEMRFYVEVPEEQRVRAETWLEHNWAEPE